MNCRGIRYLLFCCCYLCLTCISTWYGCLSSSSWRSQSTRSRPLGRWMTSSCPAPACSRRVWSSGECWQSHTYFLAALWRGHLCRTCSAVWSSWPQGQGGEDASFSLPCIRLFSLLCPVRSLTIAAFKTNTKCQIEDWLLVGCKVSCLVNYEGRLVAWWVCCLAGEFAKED